MRRRTASGRSKWEGSGDRPSHHRQSRNVSTEVKHHPLAPAARWPPPDFLELRLHPVHQEFNFPHSLIERLSRNKKLRAEECEHRLLIFVQRALLIVVEE